MKRLKELRKENNLNQKEFAKILNMSQTGYSKYEVGTNDLPTEILKKIATYYKVSIDYLLCLTNIKKSYNNSAVNCFNNRLKEIREDKDLTQLQIAQILNMSRTGYSDYETGNNDIPTKILIKLAIYYNVSIDYLLYLTDERIPHKRK